MGNIKKQDLISRLLSGALEGVNSQIDKVDKQYDKVPSYRAGQSVGKKGSGVIDNVIDFFF